MICKFRYDLEPSAFLVFIIDFHRELIFRLSIFNDIHSVFMMCTATVRVPNRHRIKKGVRDEKETEENDQSHFSSRGKLTGVA